MATKLKAPRVNGRRVAAADEHLIPSRLTDEGIERRNRETKAEFGPRVSVTSRDEMAMQAYEAAQDGKLEAWNGANPLKEAEARVRRPGFRTRFLSPLVVEKRGMRGYVPVLTKDGSQVKVGRLFAAQMPEEVARTRDTHYQNEGNEALQAAQEEHQEQQERAARAAGLVGYGPLQPGDVVRDVQDRTHAASVGLHSTRGNRTEAIAE